MAVRHALELITKTGIDQRIGHGLEIADTEIIPAVVGAQEKIGDEYDSEDVDAFSRFSASSQCLIILEYL
jgi:hypothetical protein